VAGEDAIFSRYCAFLQIRSGRKWGRFAQFASGGFVGIHFNHRLISVSLLRSKCSDTDLFLHLVVVRGELKSVAFRGSIDVRVEAQVDEVAATAASS
jgi:hypothetical protein